MGLSADLVDETRLFTALSLLTECLDSELIAANGPNRCWHGMWPGQAYPSFGSLMACTSDCGVSWVQVMSLYPSAQFPLPDQAQATRCASPMAMEVRLGVARCLPRARDREANPDPQVTFDSIRLSMSDERAMKRAVLCCLPERAKTNADMRSLDVSLGAWTPIELGAGVTGGTWRAYIG